MVDGVVIRTVLAGDVGTKLQHVAVAEAVCLLGLKLAAINHGAVHGALVRDVDTARGWSGGCEYGVLARDGGAVDVGVGRADHELRLRGVLGCAADVDGGSWVEGEGACVVLVELVGAAERHLDSRCWRVCQRTGKGERGGCGGGCGGDSPSEAAMVRSSRG